MKKRVLLIAIVALSLLISGVAMATIKGTKHDLSSSGAGPIQASSGQQNNEICVWCHTPHGANTAFTGAPLWNKATPGGSYTLYGTTEGGSTALLDTETTFAVTKACLSCHDGASAINSLVNQAGSGGYNASGHNVAFGTTADGTAFTMPSGGATDIGTDLSNDHPVNFIYDTTKSSLRTPDGTTSAIVKVLSATSVQGVSGTSIIQCSSCHDPHDNTNGTFLRVNNSGSSLCLACHLK